MRQNILLLRWELRTPTSWFCCRPSQVPHKRLRNILWYHKDLGGPPRVILEVFDLLPQLYRCDIVLVISRFSNLANKICDTDRAERAMGVLMDIRDKDDDSIKAGCELSYKLMFHGKPPADFGDLRFYIFRKQASARSIRPEKLPDNRSCSAALSIILSPNQRLAAAAANSIIWCLGVWKEAWWPMSRTGPFNRPHRIGLSSEVWLRFSCLLSFFP